MDLKPLVFIKIVFCQNERCGMCLKYITKKFCSKSTNYGVYYCADCSLKSIKTGVFGFVK